MRTTRLRVTMREVVPQVERVIDVPATITLDELHEVLQVAIGWTDSHLHQFRTDDAIYAVPFEDVGRRGARSRRAGRDACRRCRRASSTPTTSATGGSTTIEVLGRGGDQPGCVGGEGACPPEDCGGPDGYAELLETLADPRHPEHESMSTWVGDRLRPFDQEATTRRVRDAVGVVPGSVRLLLDLLADGVKLTPGGRLPRAVVRAVQEQRPGWNPLDRPASIEEDLSRLPCSTTCCATSGWSAWPTASCAPPRPLPTSSRRYAGSDPGSAEGVLDHGRRARRGPGRSPRPTAGPADRRRGAPSAGPRLERGGNRSPLATSRRAPPSADQLQALDLITRSRSSWSPGPSARSLLPERPCSPTWCE